MPRSTSASTARSSGRATFILLAASPIALMKQADQPAANNCSGLVPLPAVPGDVNLTSRRPSELREVPSRPPVVCVLAVYSTLSSWIMACSLVEVGHVVGSLELVSTKEYRRCGRILHTLFRNSSRKTWQVQLTEHDGRCTTSLNASDWVALGRYRSRAPTDPYVLAFEHTVLQLMASLRV